MIQDTDTVKGFTSGKQQSILVVQLKPKPDFFNPFETRYNGNANAALKMLNKARKDPVLGQKALLLMIDIYVNPTGGVLGGDAMENGNIGDVMANGAGGDKESLKDVALSTAETLIRVC